MNYFAHGRHYTRDPYFLAGTALPDWLSVVDRRIRVKSADAARRVNDLDPRVAAVARGVVVHHRDDARFHATRAFTEISLQFSASAGEVLGGNGGMQAGFLGHVLVELLLDAALIEEDPGRLEDYYRAVESLDGAVAQEAVRRIAGRDAEGLPALIRGFCELRFLSDYLDDDRLFFRLGQIMRRVKLPPLPETLVEVLPPSRREVRRRKAELLGEQERL